MVNEWTSNDMPSVSSLGLYGRRPDLDIDGMRFGAAVALEAVVDHLNANHPKSGTDRWRRAHEIVEGERDQAREQWKKWEHKADEWKQEHDLLVVHGSVRGDTYAAMGRERDEWKARAEAAEARPAVTREEVAEAISRAWGEDGSVSPHGVLDRLWPLVSGADPAVLVVRESDVAAVEVTRDSDGWYADGAWVASADETAEWVRDRAAEMVVYAARNEAVARAIEAGQAVDPVEAKARELAKAGGVDFDEQEPEGVEMLIGMARHVLGQGAGDE